MNFYNIGTSKGIFGEERWRNFEFSVLYPFHRVKTRRVGILLVIKTLTEAKFWIDAMVLFIINSRLLKITNATRLRL